ncbi:hypothetical protein F4553_001099 [Allocatelliglobosispora scoriae]|uniref:Uncharacterized protein n=1 Tax=Allocatelliglobosispora scoriae TaxID=643052 RepID=A0A841BLM4_9ACTN|nr:hypothetical protein [Allocatelliglobosispora scoriae]MBB5867720.1 hypothetical protein [Allocatelliglobosispora scoriae]
MPASAQIFPFAFDRVAGVILPVVGIRPATARVLVDDDLLRVEFGPFRLETPRANITDASVTGPYLWVKVIGAHLSLADRGVTFGTNRDAGVCVRFREPVQAMGVRFGIRHPGATVTVADPAALAAALSSRTGSVDPRQG